MYGLRMRLFFSLGKQYVKEGSGKGYLSPYMAPLWNLEGVGSFTGDFEGQVIIQRALLLGTPRDMYKKALEMGISLARGPVWGTWREGFFSRDFEIEVIIWWAPPLGTPRVVKEGFGKGISLVVSMREPGGGLLYPGI